MELDEFKLLVNDIGEENIYILTFDNDTKTMFNVDGKPKFSLNMLLSGTGLLKIPLSESGSAITEHVSGENKMWLYKHVCDIQGVVCCEDVVDEPQLKFTLHTML